MMNLLLLLLLALAGLSLMAGLFFLYRYLVRSRLFPQLPRIWSGDRRRFLLLSSLFALSLGAFALVGILTRPPAEPAPQLGYAPPAPPAPAAPTPAEPTRLEAPELPRPDRPSPPPQALAEPATPPAREERVLPPQEPAPLPTASQPQPVPEVLPTTPQGPPPVAAPPALPAPAAPALAGAPPAPLPPEPPAQKPPAPDPPAPGPAKPAAPGEEVFWVCLGSFKDQASAVASQARLKTKGLETQVWRVDLGAKGTWYRVCSGQFKSPAQAGVQAQAWKKEGLDPSPFVTRKP